MPNQTLATPSSSKQIAVAPATQKRDLLTRKLTDFVLWRPAPAPQPPRLIIGTVVQGQPCRFSQIADVPLAPSTDSPEVYEVSAASLMLPDGVYHYWFLVMNANVYSPQNLLVAVTDPCAFVTDWRVLRDGAPAAVIGLKNGTLYLCDSDGNIPLLADTGTLESLAPNNRLVLYEIPTAWTRESMPVTPDSVGVGTYGNVRTLVDGSPSCGPFSPPARHLKNLGVNGIQLLPWQDSADDRSKWGYGTANYFAPDFDLSFYESSRDTPARSATDLSALIEACHANGIRVFMDAVMAFSKRDAYCTANYLDFHVQWKDPKTTKPAENDPEQSDRNGFGGDLFKYAWKTQGWNPMTGDALDPTTGAPPDIYPAREYMKCAITHWVKQYHIDGVRLDSITNVKNFDFMGEFRDVARNAWQQVRAPKDDSLFLVLGESLPVKKDYLRVGDALWNEEFKQILRNVILGQNWENEQSFEWCVRKLIEPINLGYERLAQAINYIGSHDVGGKGNERLFDYLQFCGVWDKLPRYKLAFTCLLTAVGIPMILAGDEFADQHDIKIWDLSEEERQNRKQMDPVNFDRLTESWRKELFDCVSRLVKLRTTEMSLQVSDTNFIHRDFEDGKRVLAWVRGNKGADRPVVVVANFSSWGTDPNLPGAEYVVPNWPAPGGSTDWVEVTSGRAVPKSWIGREPLFPWEAKVYVPK